MFACCDNSLVQMNVLQTFILVCIFSSLLITLNWCAPSNVAALHGIWWFISLCIFAGDSGNSNHMLALCFLREKIAGWGMIRKAFFPLWQADLVHVDTYVFIWFRDLSWQDWPSSPWRLVQLGWRWCVCCKGSGFTWAVFFLMICFSRWLCWAVQ